MEGQSEKTTYRITDLSISERPRERLERLNAGSLQTAELMAILIRTGIKGLNAVELGQHLLAKYGDISGLHAASFKDICLEKGIGRAKAAQIKAALELGHRLAQEGRGERPTVHNPADAAALVQHSLGVLEQEEMHVMLLDTRNRVIDIKKIYQGSTNTAHVRIGELFKEAIRQNAAGIIVLHNHPSGDPSPSPDDVAVTRGILQAGKLLEIDVLDHLVIGKGDFVSLKERKLGFG